LTPAQTLRSLILMRVKNWDYRELRERIADGYTLRAFTQFESQRIPQHDAFNRAFNRLTPETLQAINGATVDAAVMLGLEDGTKLRVDTTVAETDIHWPTDSTLLWDTVRVVSRLVRQLDHLLPTGVGPFTLRTRAARRRMQEIQRMTANERHTQQVPTYRALIGITEGVVAEARAVVVRTRAPRSGGVLTGATVAALKQQIASYCDLGDRVISQTRRRVMQGEQVPPTRRSIRSSNRHRSDQTWQGAEADRVRPQSVPRRECPRLDHAVSRADRQYRGSRSGRPVVGVPHRYLWPCPRAL
jgi:IS5 family transposase